MSFVLVLDTTRQPRDPIRPAVARKLLKEGKAAVWRRYPFTIILKESAPGPEPAPLQVEHITPRARGGSNRVSNLTLACEPCNQAKGNRTASEFGFPQLQAQAKASLKDAAAVNMTRWALYKRLLATGLPAETGTGGRTKYNRAMRGLEKTHWLDAACVGSSTPLLLKTKGIRPLQVKAVGHGTRQVCRTDKYGFPKRHKPRARSFRGWKTGDIVRAVVSSGKYAGVTAGRIAIRFRPSFRLNGQDVHSKYLIRLHRADGYDYRAGGTPLQEGAIPPHA
jgi:hypothetical protein